MGTEAELIKERLDIAELVREYVPLKQAGKSLKGLCPFHQEKTPSFIVSPDRGTWHCFGCSEGGDAFTFIEKIEGVDFAGALKMLAERTGVELRRTSDTKASSDRRQRLFDLLAAAARFYHEILVNHDAGSKARDYLTERGVKSETIKTFQIGYAPNQWDGVSRWLANQGFSHEEMEQVGLVGMSRKGTRYDRFRGRIMFPISDTQGRVVAFGGRIVPWHETGNEGKYINSPEGMLYEKRRVVYNLSRAKKELRAGKPCIVVEGYMDVVMLTQAGIANVVASSGTAFTPEQIGQLKRFTDTLRFAFDADAAGWKATISATEYALTAGMRIATIRLPAGMDPADVALQKPNAVGELFRSKESLLVILLDQLKASEGKDDQQAQLDAFVSLVRRVSNPIVQGGMIQEAAGILHVPEARIMELVQQQPVSYTRQEELQNVNESQGQRQAPYRTEQHLLALCLLNTDVREGIFNRLEESFFLDLDAQMLYNELKKLSEHKKSFSRMSFDKLISALDERSLPFAEGLRSFGEELLSTTSNTPIQEAELLLHSLRRRHIRTELIEAQQTLSGVSGKARAKAMKQFQSLAEELAQIDNS